MPFSPAIPQNRVGVTLDPYIVAGFMPRTYPMAGALGKSACSVGTHSTSAARAAQLAIDMGCTTRWIADPAKLVDNGDGTWRWYASQGSNQSPYWSFDASAMPEVDASYSWTLRDGTEVAYPAFLFPGSVWGTLVGFPDRITGFTVLIVARFRGTNGGAYANVFASVVSATDPDHSADTALQWRDHRMRTIETGYVVYDDIIDTGRPQVVGVRQSYRVAYQIVGDTNWTIRSLSHPPVNAYDMNWFIGRPSDSYHDELTLRADVLDICLWANPHTPAELQTDGHRLNGIYGVVR